MADATKQKEASTRHFDQWATSYEEDATSRWLATLQDAAVEALSLEAWDRLLDVGCGTGAAVRRAAPAVERAIGVDLSPAMVARARELAAGLENVEFQEGDSERLPFGDGEFTAILCTTSFHHYPGPQRAVSEMARVSCSWRPGRDRRRLQRRHTCARAGSRAPHFPVEPRPLQPLARARGVLPGRRAVPDDEALAGRPQLRDHGRGKAARGS